jgi:hypothetical protein
MSLILNFEDREGNLITIVRGHGRSSLSLSLSLSCFVNWAEACNHLSLCRCLCLSNVLLSQIGLKHEVISYNCFCQ